MSAATAPWVEGEKIPDERIRDIFRPHPGIASKFYRSSLVIGSRGVGKTTLFRYQKETHEGVGIHLSLATEFASLTKQTGYGSLAVDIPPNIEASLMGKAVSLLAISISDRFIKKGLGANLNPLHECLPEQFRTSTTTIDERQIAEIKRAITSAPIEMFEGLYGDQALPSFVSAIGEQIQQSHGPLLLLLDRADMVLAPALAPVFELLDQSTHYIALVAMRPGLPNHAIANIAESVVAGDHYAIVHLGTQPRAPEWIEFVEGAVQAQIGQKFSQIPREIKDWVISISRDSLRTALELFARYMSASTSSAKDELVAAMEDLRENYLAAAQRTLQKYHPDFRKMINDLRARVLNEHGRIPGPILLSLEKRAEEDLFHSVSRLDRFVDAGLRSGALCMPEGHRWIPGLRLTQVEIPPLLVWQKNDDIWSASSCAPVSITTSHPETG